jgi:hypothetical protein
VSKPNFKLHGSPEGFNHPTAPKAHNPAKTAKEAADAGESLVEAGQAAMTSDGEEPIEWPAAPGVKHKPFKI